MKKMTSASVVLGLALVMTGCATNTGYQSNGSARAAMQGAIAGAAIGALSKSDGNRNDIGKAAAVGAVAGAGTGYVLSTTPSYPYQK